MITGYIEIDKDIIYSSCIVINEGKIIYNYRRISKGWKEFYKADYHYQEGDSVKEFELKGKKFMIALCGDLWDYPERFKTNNILIWPVYVNFSLDKWESIKFDYAKQANKAAAKTLLVNSIDKNPKSLGGAFYFENGKISLSNGFNDEKILIVDIPTDKMIYDITQPLFECEVFPGDSKPEKQILQRIDNGDVCNLTGFSMCAHNGTHVDAPYHFINEGKPINQVSLEKFIGPAFVIEHNGEVLEKDAYEMLEKAKKAYKGSEKKILIKGKATVSLEAAKVFAQKGIDLVGNESQTVGPENAPKEVHLVLLGAEVVLLEGIRLAHVPDGVYLLNCAPLNLTNTDGSPCRATLMSVDMLK